MSLRIAVGADHAGFSLKKAIADHLSLQGHQVTDFGTYSTESADYPDFAHLVAYAVERGESAWGILVCGSANGVAITANKHQGIRAGLAWNPEVAALVRQHNDANVLCLPSRFITLEQALECVDIFLKTTFEGGRHQRRVAKIGC
ncbi:MAG: ribose 5-phosphate isomerase B [Cytophagaceae bacterium]|nr:ribose 5-phosphate isomerase B [Cytophagaceae bacterium]